jgi:hypothetical protein
MGAALLERGIGFLKGPFPSKGKVRLNLRGVKHASPRPAIRALLSGPSSARGAMFRSVLASRSSEGTTGRVGSGAEPGIGAGSGQFESIEGLGRCSGRRSGGPAQMGEDLGHHGGISMAVMIVKGPPDSAAVFHIDLEHSFEQPGPAWGQAPRKAHLTVVR